MSEVLVADAQISRRRVVQGIAWAAPAIAIATAVPAAAASDPTPEAGPFVNATTATWARSNIGKPSGASGNWSHAVSVGITASYGSGAGLPLIAVLDVVLTFVSLQAGPLVATDNGGGYVLNAAPTDWSIQARTADTVTLRRTNVAPGANLSFTNFAVSGSGAGAKLTGVMVTGTDANGHSFTKPIAVPA
jgi:hypothetical protein